MKIPGFSSYDITPDGVVTCINTGRVIPAYITATANGYYKYKRVYIVDDSGNKRTCAILHLLALAFLEKPNCACVAKPKDGNTLNACLENAEWVPCCKVTQAAWANGKFKDRKKRSTACSKESIELLLNTLQQFDAPISMLQLSELLCVPYSTVRYSMYYLRDSGVVEHTGQKGWKIKCSDH